MTTTIIPAQPGFKLLVCYLHTPDSGTAKIDEEHHVIAWSIDDSDDDDAKLPKAITVGGSVSEWEPHFYAVEEPSGRVTMGEVGTFVSRTDWLSHVLKQAKAK